MRFLELIDDTYREIGQRILERPVFHVTAMATVTCLAFMLFWYRRHERPDESLVEAILLGVFGYGLFMGIMFGTCIVVLLLGIHYGVRPVAKVLVSPFRRDRRDLVRS